MFKQGFVSIINKIVWGGEREVRKPYRAFSICTRIINCGKLEDFMSINPFDVLIDWLISLFRAFCFIIEELSFNVDGLETFTLQPMWRRINPPFILSNHPWHSFKQFLSPIQETPLLSKLFLIPIHKRVYSTKLRRNWNVLTCVEKHAMHDLHRERPIRLSTWWLLLFAFSKLKVTVIVDKEIF